MNKTHYELLGVSPNAPTEVIVAAHIALRQKYHPDQYASMQEKTHAQAQSAAIDLAAQVLSNKKSREEYDAFLLNQSTQAIPPHQPPKKKRGFLWLLVLVFLLWLCYVLASVGYDFYKLSTANTVNQDTQIVLPPPKTLESKDPIEIPIKDDSEQQERVLWEQKFKAKQQNFDQFWQQLDEQTQQMLLIDQEEWLIHVKADCQSMASNANKVRIEELLKCQIRQSLGANLSLC